MKDGVEAIGFITGIIGVIVLIALIMGFPTMWLWNYLVPSLFPGAVAAGTVAAKITFWKGFWLNVLCAILFKSNTVSKS